MSFGVFKWASILRLHRFPLTPTVTDLHFRFLLLLQFPLLWQSIPFLLIQITSNYYYFQLIPLGTLYLIRFRPFHDTDVWFTWYYLIESLLYDLLVPVWFPRYYMTYSFLCDFLVTLWFPCYFMIHSLLVIVWFTRYLLLHDLLSTVWPTRYCLLDTY